MRCNKKRARVQFEKYFPLIEGIHNDRGDRWIFVTLTGAYIPVDSNVAENVKKITDVAQKFLFSEYEAAGNMVVEYKVKYAEWLWPSDRGETLQENENPVAILVHFHGIVYGGYKTRFLFSYVGLAL
jgi:hypothetical protein